MLFQGFSQEFQGGLLVARLGHEALKNLAFVINRTPEIALLSIDLHENLIQMLAPVAQTQPFYPPLADFCGEHRPEPMPPESHRFVADVYAPLI